MTEWNDYSEDTRACLECRYRWPAQDIKGLSEDSACPNCGFKASVLEGQTASWDADEKLAEAKLELSIYSYRMPGGFPGGWVKDEVDKLLAALIAGGCDTSCQLSGAPADEYKWIHETDGFHSVHAIDGIGSSQSGSDRGSIKDFLDQILGRRANQAKAVFLPWVEEEHLN